MKQKRGPVQGPNYRWQLDPIRKPSQHKHAYMLRLMSNRRPVFFRQWTATQLRSFADVAVDALEGNYRNHDVGRWSSKPWDTNRIEIIEHRDTVEEHMLFGRDDLDRIVARIDELLED